MRLQVPTRSMPLAWQAHRRNYGGNTVAEKKNVLVQRTRGKAAVGLSFQMQGANMVISYSCTFSDEMHQADTFTDSIRLSEW